jgi:hypothetical protein
MAAIARTRSPDRIAKISMRDDHVLDQYRFPDALERALACIGDEHVELFPDAETLAARGFNVNSVAFVLEQGKMAAQVFGDMVSMVKHGELSIDDANRVLWRLRHINTRRRLHLDDATLKGLGFDIDAVNNCIAVGALEEQDLGDLVKNVCTGLTSIAMANSGLLCLAEAA